MNTDFSPVLDNLLYLPQMLRQAGIPVGLEQAESYVSGLILVEIGQRNQVYHTARTLLISRQEHLKLFDIIFNRFWDFVIAPQRLRGQAPQTRPKSTQPRKRLDIVELMAQKAGQAEQEIDVDDKSQTYSWAELLQSKEFAAMNEAELDETKQMIQSMQWPIAQRRSRRFVSHNQGNRLDQQRILRSAMKQNGVPTKLLWQQPKIKQRPIVLLADISGSMEVYARLMLRFFYSVTHQLRQIESFVFGTRLTRVTNQLKIKNIDIAIDQAAKEIVDWSGGTRIGESLHHFNRQWSRRVVRRGALVIIVSDGWERGDVSLLIQEMRYLHNRCHRLIWLNPLSGRETYQPTVAGMSAALRHVDDFLPVHNLHSLSTFAEHLANI